MYILAAHCRISIKNYYLIMIYQALRVAFSSMSALLCARDWNAHGECRNDYDMNMGSCHVGDKKE